MKNKSGNIKAMALLPYPVNRFRFTGRYGFVSISWTQKFELT